jgi:hypothetical protein
MRYPLYLVLPAIVAACALVAKSPALSDPLHAELAKADTPQIEDAAKACLTRQGWTPDDVSGDAEGATVVSAKNAAKNRVSVYVQPPGQTPRVTGDPAYDDPFWSCLGHELATTKAPPTAPSSSADTP